MTSSHTAIDGFTLSPTVLGMTSSHTENDDLLDGLVETHIHYPDEELLVEASLLAQRPVASLSIDRGSDGAWGVKRAVGDGGAWTAAGDNWYENSATTATWEHAVAVLTALVDTAIETGQPPPTSTIGRVCQLAARLGRRFPSRCFLQVQSQEVFPVLELPDPAIAQIMSHLASVELLSVFGSLCTATASLLAHACQLRAERGGIPLPRLLPGEGVLDALRFAEAVGARRPTSIAAGSAHTLWASEERDGAWSCGGDSVGDRGFLGHLGHGELHGAPVCFARPVAGLGLLAPATVREVAARGYSSILLTSAGHVYNWGWNGDGRLGHVRRQAAPRSKPEGGRAADSSADSGYSSEGSARGWNAEVFTGHLPLPRRLACLGGVRVLQVSCGERHGLALSAEGAVWSWGRDSNGQLGRFDSAGAPPEGRVAGPGLLESLSAVRVVVISAGGLHSLALSERGELFSWGAGRDGKLGHGDGAARPLPQRVAALSGVPIARVSAGDSHSLAVSRAGELFSFGLGECGRLGHGDEESLGLPKKVEALRDARVRAIAAGFYHSIVLLEPRGGAAAAPDPAECLVYTFGDGAYGKLGHGRASLGDRLVPSPVQSLCGLAACEVAAGYQHSVVRVAAPQGRRVLTAGIGWKGQLGVADLLSGAEALGMDPDFYHACLFRPAANS